MEPISRPGEQNIILIPCRGTPDEEKSGFQTREILAVPRPVSQYPAKRCLGEKNAVAQIEPLASESRSYTRSIKQPLVSNWYITRILVSSLGKSS